MSQAMRLRCLWIGREIPIPANTGDRIYSAKLAESLADDDVQVTFLGLAGTPQEMASPAKTLSWHPVVGRMKSYGIAVFSPLPLVAAALGIDQFRSALDKCLDQPWDAVVLDNYATAWALRHVIGARRRNPKLVLVHVSHNFEARLAQQLVASFHGSLAKKVVLVLNSWKIKFWERKILAQSDVVSSITEEDCDAMRPICPPQAVQLVLTPGYSGPRLPARSLAHSNRRVVLVGSFRWVVKQENLRQLLDLADPLFAEAGVGLDVVGQVPEELVRSYQGRLRATVFHGFVADYSPIFSAARIAIVPEVIGGGFKLKILDYIFSGLPVAALSQASAGLPHEIRQTFMTSDDLRALVQLIINKIDDVQLLDQMQHQAALAASKLFEWSDRGKALHLAIEKVIDRVP